MRIFTRIVLVCACINATVVAHSQILTTKEREDLIGSAIQSCFATQRPDPINSNISDDQIRRYCSCFARTVFRTNVTKQDIVRATDALQSGGEQAMLRSLLGGRDLYKITNSCAEEATQR